MRSTPKVEMQKIVGVQALKERRDTKVMTMGEKFLSSVSHPVKERSSNLALSRLKRSSFIHQAKRMRKLVPDLPTVVAPLSSVPEHTPWKEADYAQITIQTEVKGVQNGEMQSSLVRSTATLSVLDDKYPCDTWIRVYTDGSAHNAIKNGGAGAYIEYPNNTIDKISIPTGKYCNNFDAEVRAIIAAVEKLSDSRIVTCPVVILTDARSVLEALQCNKLSDLKDGLSKIGLQHGVTLQWIPSHCGIPGNEKADRLAKEGTEMEQPDIPITYNQKKSMIKTYRKPQTPPHDDYHMLNRKEQVTIFRLRTGHSRLRSHMYTKFKVGTTNLCTCSQVPQTVEHILQNCTNYETLRNNYWLSETTKEYKLYGSIHELQKTVKFIQETGLQI